MLLLILFFLCPIMVSADIITTPYLFAGFVDECYSLQENEKIEERNKYIFQKEDELYTYSKWSRWQSKKIHGLEEQNKTVYYYQRLKSLDRIIIKDISCLFIMNVKIFLRSHHQLIANWVNTPFILKENITILLDSFYFPEDLEIEIETFMLQEKEQGSFFITGIDQQYIKKKVDVLEKGKSSQKQLLINCLIKMKWDKKVQHTQSIDHLFYYLLIKKERLYRYRFKIYKKSFLPVIVTTAQEKIEGYQLLEAVKEYALYRRERIEIYDQITLSGYIDTTKIIKSSTIPLKYLSFELVKKDFKEYIVIKYQAFSFEKEVYFYDVVYHKSKVFIGNDPSIIRKIVGKLIKLSIKKIF